MRAQAMIAAGVVEGRLRHFLSSRLSSIFPGSPWWIQAHMEGTEARVHFSTGCGRRDGFVDAVVGKTAIEYERNLTRRNIFQDGYDQVKEYCAALCNMGISQDEILGVLSDTVRWYGYSITVVGAPPADGLYGPEHIELTQTAFVDLSVDTAEEFSRFERFINDFLGREQSRLLNAKTLVCDFGMDSSFYRENIAVFQSVVRRAIEEKPDYAALIEQVWQNFVAYLGVSDYGVFSQDTYVNEFYLVTIAKVICVNILAGEPLISSGQQIRQILNGEYFTSQNLFNLVDYDYFGWLNNEPFVEGIVAFVSDMQRRLTAYDFSHTIDRDIFGQLLSQLANREHRLMLGQEFTPHWIAREIVEYQLELLGDEPPRLLDMCCGSGVFLIESVYAIRRQYHITPESYTAEKDALIFSCVMGFDIDPLAVMLAKVNWVIAMKDLFFQHHGAITIPIYHADSLFVVTPITRRMPDAADESYVFHFGGDDVSVPAFLFSPAYDRTFHSFMSKAHNIAIARAAGPEAVLSDADLSRFTDAVLQDSRTAVLDAERSLLMDSARQLIPELERLQRTGRNGIWRFIISNSYKPGLTKHQFNCIVSNPPWMAMSKLANNPYKQSLQAIARKYGIKPTGASHPHMELSTIFLLSAVDRYLKEGAHWSFVMPGSLLRGLNHEPLRGERYRISEMALSMRFTGLWELPKNTFKNKAIVLSGAKGARATPASLPGRVYEEEGRYSSCTYVLSRQGPMSTWTNRDAPAARMERPDDGPLPFTQGCDLFPRTNLFHNFTRRPDGDWDISEIQKTDELWYLVSDRKKAGCANLCVAGFSKEYLFDAYISKHLSPFFLAPPAKVILPGRKEAGSWEVITPMERALMNASTAYAFDQLEQCQGQNLPSYLNTINIYGKLEKQDFSAGDWLVLSSASGSNPCAAYLPLDGLDRSRIVVDQTLYWHIAASEDEAIYITALLNSTFLSDAIKDFQPEGGFGERHIHKLPYKITPYFDAKNQTHQELVRNARTLISEWLQLCRAGKFAALLQPNSGSLNRRRRQQQAAIRELPSYESYEAACRVVLQLTDSETITPSSQWGKQLMEQRLKPRAGKNKR